MYKKLLIASAATLLASSAFAQSSVTLYGLIDEAVRYETNAGTRTVTVNPLTGAVTLNPVLGAVNTGSALKLDQGQFNGTRWGMKGVEDLGSGLKAVFQLESGFTLADGKSGQGGRLFGRQAYVGLSTNAGTVTVGRQYTPTFNFAGDFDPIGISNESETSPELAYAAFREDNSINYAANFSGFNVQAMYGFGGVAGSNRQNSLMGIRAGYTIAGVGIGAVYQQNNNNGGAAVVPGFAGSSDVKNIGVGLSYAFGPVKVMGNWLNTKNVNGLSGAKSDLFTLGANYLVTPQVNLIAAGYYDRFSNMASNSSSRYTLMGSAQYLVSKRTTVYVSVDYTKERQKSIYEGYTGAGGSPAALASGSNNRTNVMLGLRHAF